MSERTFSHRYRQRLERATEHYLRDCYKRRSAARVTEFAAFLDLAQPYLSRTASLITGMSLGKFLRDRQLRYAATLLRATPLSIETIALASAFGTRSTFHRLFKAAFAITPGAYRAEVMECDTSEKVAASAAGPFSRASALPD